MISSHFPKSHTRAGQLTFFIDEILKVRKIHTIRDNFDLWKKRVDEVNKGEAIISIRTWEGLPYRSKQIEKLQLTKHSGCGVELITMYKHSENEIVYSINSKNLEALYIIARNDGLQLEDFRKWFFPEWKGKEQYFKGAIIHFTNFRYEKAKGV